MVEKEARFHWFPLSSVLSPLVPRGERMQSLMQPWGGLANDGEFPRNGDGHFVRVRWDVVGRHFAAGPAHLKLRGRLGCAHHLHGAVLRPITRAGVNFARGKIGRAMHTAK